MNVEPTPQSEERSARERIRAIQRARSAGCTAGRWVSPTLDAIRRRLGR